MSREKITDAPAVDGVLKYAHIMGEGDDRSARGSIFGDTKGRFKDGEIVRTSRIVSGPDADGVIVTRNSRYRLEMAA